MLVEDPEHLAFYVRGMNKTENESDGNEKAVPLSTYLKKTSTQPPESEPLLRGSIAATDPKLVE